MDDYTYTDADWRENAKYGLDGVTADDATEHWDRWLAEHDAALIEKLADEQETLPTSDPGTAWAQKDSAGWLREKARQRREEKP